MRSATWDGSSAGTDARQFPNDGGMERIEIEAGPSTCADFVGCSELDE